MEQECLAIVWGITKFQEFLYEFLGNAKFENNRLMRWSLALQPYRFGCENVDTDFLSRLPCDSLALSASTLLVGWQEGHLVCKKEWWGAGVVVCLEQGADLHIAQLMPLPLTVSCFSKIQIGFTFLVPAHLGSPGKRAVKWACACVLPCDST